MEREFYTSPKPGFIMKQLWKAAGADEYILSRSTYSDQVKYACLGGIVVATGFMAALAGGYAFYTIFEPKGSAGDMTTDVPTAIKSCIFGIIWGLIIFNIDRFIVAATGKGDGTEAITIQEIKGSLPRILMGLIIALTISKPMEIRMFKTEIDMKLEEKQDKLAQEFKKSRTIDIYERIKNDQEKIKEWKAEIDKEKQLYQKFWNEFNKEMNGESGAGGYGKEAKKKEALMKEQKAELDIIKARNTKFILDKENEIEAARKELKEVVAKSKETASGLDGLLERIKLAHEVAGTGISLFITLLFVVIELTPIFFKMMLVKSPYDFMHDNVKELIKAENGIEIKYDYYKDKEGKERNLVIHHLAEKALQEKIGLLKAQKELSEEVIKKWKAEELKKAEDNIDEYIK